jgi:hypothetical protein
MIIDRKLYWLEIIEYLQKRYGNLMSFKMEEVKQISNEPAFKIIHLVNKANLTSEIIDNPNDKFNYHEVWMQSVDFFVGGAIVRYYFGVCRECKKVFVAGGHVRKI